MKKIRIEELEEIPESRDLTKVDLTRANLTRENLFEANLTKADLTKVECNNDKLETYEWEPE